MKCAAVSSAAPKAVLRAIENYCDRVIPLPPHPALAAPVASHADMIFSVIDKTVFFDKIYLETCRDTVCEIVRAGDFDLRETGELGEKYPHDVALNLLVGEKFAAGLDGAAAPELRAFAEDSGRKFVPVKQGYAACSCLLAGNFAVTADRGLASALSPFCETLLIREGSVELPPYPYGFIGGASGFDGKRAFFAGDLSSHPDGETVFDGLSERGFGAVSLSNEALSDCGGIRFIYN